MWGRRLVAGRAKHAGFVPALSGRVSSSESQLDRRSPFVKQSIIFIFFVVGSVFTAALRPRPSVNSCPGPCWLASALTNCLFQEKYVFSVVRDVLAVPATRASTFLTLEGSVPRQQVACPQSFLVFPPRCPSSDLPLEGSSGPCPSCMKAPSFLFILSYSFLQF